MIPLDRLDKLVVELWRRRGDSHKSAMQLMRALFAEEGLRPKQQKRVKTLFHGWLSSEQMIEYALEVAAPAQIVKALANPIRLLTSRVLSGDLSPKAATTKLPWIDWQRVAGVPAEVRALADPVQRLALIGSISTWLAKRMHEVLGAEAQDCLEALLGKAPVTLRANTLRCTREELAARLASQEISTKPTQLASHGLELLEPAQVLRTAAFQQGWFELQDEASQLVAELVAPPPNGLVLDACAGAGGKSLAIAMMLDAGASVVALDTDAARLASLRQRARRAGASNIRAMRVKADAWPMEVEDLAGRADRILVDAPCTGLGSLRRNPDLRDRICEEAVWRHHRIQVCLLERAARSLAPQARMVYATCTLLPEENCQVVDEVQARIPGLHRVPIAEIIGGERGAAVARDGGMALQTLPHRHRTDGFYAAVLAKA